MLRYNPEKFHYQAKVKAQYLSSVNISMTKNNNDDNYKTVLSKLILFSIQNNMLISLFDLFIFYIDAI